MYTKYIYMYSENYHLIWFNKALSLKNCSSTFWLFFPLTPHDKITGYPNPSRLSIKKDPFYKAKRRSSIIFFQHVFQPQLTKFRHIAVRKKFEFYPIFRRKMLNGLNLAYHEIQNSAHLAHVHSAMGSFLDTEKGKKCAKHLSISYKQKRRFIKDYSD